MDLKEILFSLSAVDAVGCVKDAADLAAELLSGACETMRADGLTVVGTLKGESDYTLMLDAHIDQVAMVVTDVDDEGFLTVANSGGIDIRALPSRRVTIHGRQKVNGVFCSTPPHLSNDKVEYDDISKLKIDTVLGNNARNIISAGDYVTFAAQPKNLCGDRVCGKSFDDRAGVTCLIYLAHKLKDKKLPFNIAFVLSDGEELAMRGTRTASFRVNPDEAVAIDVSFADGIGIDKESCGTMGKGTMIGISPVLDSAISDRFVALASQEKIAYQTEVMGSRTGTNADMISVNRNGVRCGLLSIPLRNMHTEVEIIDLKDLQATCDLLCAYILSGGVKNV